MINLRMKTAIIVVSLFSLCACAGAFAATSKKPNILLILADDMGYADLSVHGCKHFKTPNIDSIFNGGVRFTNGYVTNSVCAPSRAGLISGRLGSYFGFEANLPQASYRPDSTIGLDPEQRTIADVLKPAGYKTYLFGKWHLGYNLDLFHPNKRGFDEFVGLLGGSRSYFKIAHDRGQSLQHNGNYLDEPEDMYITDYLTDHALEMIQNQHANSPEQPFFIFMSYTAPHGPMHAKESDLARVSHIEKEKRRTYAAMVLNMDDNIGRLQRCLDDLGIARDTIVVFLSDNGGPLTNGSYNGRLKGKKGNLSEGGIRVPFAIQWPSVIPAGQVSDVPIYSMDLLPTFAAASGADQLSSIVTDGVDLMPLLTGEVTDPAPRAVFWRRGNMEKVAARYRNYKYLADRANDTEYLYDLSRDISERNNLASSKPEVLQVMRKVQAKWEATVPDPTFSSDWKAKNQK